MLTCYGTCAGLQQTALKALLSTRNRMCKLVQVSNLLLAMRVELLQEAASAVSACILILSRINGSPVDGDVGSSKGAKAETFTLQELQGKTNKALMVKPSSSNRSKQNDCCNFATWNVRHVC